MCWHQTFDLPTTRDAVGFARQRSTSHLVAVAPDLRGSETLWDLELMLSEMVTNAVQAGASGITVTTGMHRDSVRIVVGDDAAGWPQPRTASSGDSSGRGLPILDALSSKWGVAGEAGRKQVWVLMPVPNEVRTPPDCRF